MAKSDRPAAPEPTRVYKPSEFAELVGVSVATLYRWDKDGTLRASRTPTGRLCYTVEHYNRYINQPPGTDTSDS